MAVSGSVSASGAAVTLTVTGTFQLVESNDMLESENEAPEPTVISLLLLVCSRVTGQVPGFEVSLTVYSPILASDSPGSSSSVILLLLRTSSEVGVTVTVPVVRPPLCACADAFTFTAMVRASSNSPVKPS